MGAAAFGACIVYTGGTCIAWVGATGVISMFDPAIDAVQGDISTCEVLERLKAEGLATLAQGMLGALGAVPNMSKTAKGAMGLPGLAWAMLPKRKPNC